jgi:NTE family protein
MEKIDTKPTVSLVLSSGGARGLFHIGVIEWLIENGFVIKSIAGSSIGALVGGMYATGKLDVYSQWVMSLKKMDMVRLLDISYCSSALFKGEKIIQVLREMIGEHYIEDLSVSYTAVATDMNKKQEVWFNSGTLFDAIRASIAIPGIFTPHEYLGTRFIDGSLVNPAPLAATLDDETDLTIVVDLNGDNLRASQSQENTMDISDVSDSHGFKGFLPKFFRKSAPPKTASPSFYDVLINSMETMQNTISKLQQSVKVADVTITIPADTCSFYEFYRAREMIDLGKHRATEVLSKNLFETTDKTSINKNEGNYVGLNGIPCGVRPYL